MSKRSIEIEVDDESKHYELEELGKPGGGAACDVGQLIKPLSTIGEIDGVTIKHNAEKDKVTLQVEMTAERVNSLFGGNVVYKSDYPNAQALDILLRSPGMSYMLMWELFEDDFITVTNYPKKKYVMVSTNHMVVSFDYDENGKVTGKRQTQQASVQQIDEVKATVPNSATVNETNELVMQRTDGDVVSELFKVGLPMGGGSSGGSENLNVRLVASVTIDPENPPESIVIDRDNDGNPFELRRAIIYTDICSTVSYAQFVVNGAPWTYALKFNNTDGMIYAEFHNSIMFAISTYTGLRANIFGYKTNHGAVANKAEYFGPAKSFEILPAQDYSKGTYVYIFEVL